MYNIDHLDLLIYDNIDQNRIRKTNNGLIFD